MTLLTTGVGDASLPKTQKHRLFSCSHAFASHGGQSRKDELALLIAFVRVSSSLLIITSR